MKLKELLKDIPVIAIVGSEDVEITDVNIDSRRIKDGHLFIAMKGTQVDGHKFVPKAIELGAKAVMCEDMPEEKAEGVTYVQVESTEDVVGKVATTFHGNPSTKLKLVGVTGTNGKTTIATLLYNMFTKMGHKCGLLSTVCNYIIDEAIPADHTTPDPIELNRLLDRMVQAADGELVVGLLDGDDDVQLAGTLVDHADVDVGVGNNAEDARGGAFGIDHALTDDGDEGQAVLDAHVVGVQLRFDLVQDLVPRGREGCGGDDDGDRVDA